jgi:hypothetical protein
MSRIIITGVNDNPHYQDHMRVLLMSLKKNAPKEWVCVVLVNCSTEYFHECFDINENIGIVVVESKEGAINRISEIHKIVLKHMTWYDQIAVLDNDTIARAPLDGLWEGVGKNTLKVWKRKDKADPYKIQAGVMVMGNGKPLRRWMKCVIEKELKHEQSARDGYYSKNWLVSQELLYHCMNKDIDYVKLPIIYNDSKFRDGSVIWHCKSSHFNDPKFQKEYKKYLCLSQNLEK